MSFIEFKNFAKQIGLSEKQLIEQFKHIGVNIKDSAEFITEKQKKDLLNYLEKKYSKKEKIIKNERWLTLKRKKITNINIKGKNTIVITKRNHTYVKSDPLIKKNDMNKEKNDDMLDKKSNNIPKRDVEKTQNNLVIIKSKKNDNNKTNNKFNINNKYEKNR